MTKRIYLNIILCMLMVTHLAVGQYNLEGKVLNVSDQQAIVGVEIFNHQTQEIKISDQDGYYSFENLSEGEYDFTLFGIQHNSSNVTLSIKENKIYNFLLSPLEIELTGVEIIAKREELFGIKQLQDIEGTSIFAGKKSEVILMDLIKGNLANNTGRQIYAQVTGLNIYEGAEGGLQLNIGGRGLDPNRTSNFNTRQNGYDISADVLGYPESYYAPPSEALQEIRILRGASSLQYGTQFGGVIDFRLRKIPRYKKIDFRSNQTYSSFNSFNSFNYLGLNKGNFSVNAYHNYKLGDGYRQNSEYDSHNSFLHFAYLLSPNTRLDFEFSYFQYLSKQAGGLTDDQFETNPKLSTRSRNWFAVNWQLYNLKLNHQFSESTIFNISLFGLNAFRKSVGFRGNPIVLNENPILALDERDSDGNYILPRDLIEGQFKNYGTEIKLISQQKLFNRKTVPLIGFKFYQANNRSIQGAGSLGKDADFNFYNASFPDYANQSDFEFPNFNAALFAETIFYLNDKLSLTPGIRIEHIKTASEGNYQQVIFDNAGNPIAKQTLQDNRDLKRNFVLFGLGLSFKKSEALQLVTNLSQNYRSVTFSDIRVVNPSFIVDPEIKDEQGATLDIGIKGRINKVFSYDWTVYSILYQDRIGTVLDDRANRVRKNIGSALIAGSESLLSINLARWISKTNRSYRFSSFINLAATHSKYLSSESANVADKKVEFIPSLNSKVGLDLGFKNFDFSYQFSYLSEQFTDAQNSLRADSGDSRAGLVGQIPSYHVSDITMSYQWNTLKLSGGINNLLNQNYYTRRATGYPGPGIIPSDGRSFFITISYQLERT